MRKTQEMFRLNISCVFRIRVNFFKISFSLNVKEIIATCPFSPAKLNLRLALKFCCFPTVDYRSKRYQRFSGFRRTPRAFQD